MPDVSDLRSTIVPKSDQLNAEQLLGGEMVITVTNVTIGSGDDQPVSVHHNLDPQRPYKPCKTMRKVLIFAWGEDGRKWAGKSMTLFNDESVRFGGMAVGGIRIKSMSHIDRDVSVSLTATKGKKSLHTIKVMQAAELVDHAAAINAAENVEALKAAFKVAYRAANGQAQQAEFKAAYDARMAAIPVPNGGPSAA